MNPTVAAPASRPPPSATLRSVHVGLREDLEVSRHVFRGEPTYIVRDPMTFQSQRLGVADYELYVHLHSGRSLGETFQELVQRKRIDAGDEEQFFEFVIRLHRLGFLQLPISDDKLLYRRYQMRRQSRRREKFMGFLFLRIPLWNPNTFLDRTIRWAKMLFHPVFLFFWVLLMLAAGVVAGSRWSELAEPVNGILLAQNLPLLWTTLIVLKFFHEMGHAYACKHYGGHVPETGVYLILFTPCAYLDATAAWGFPQRRHRIIVSLAGMYVESIFAAIAVLVWASTEPSLLNSLAYNVIFLAGITTVVFNINPLMRYDGYYILSDWLEVPNLRSRATQQVQTVLKRVLLGLKTDAVLVSRRLGWILFGFGVAATIYRFGLLFALAAVLASRVLILGIILGFGYLAWIAYSSIRKLFTYLWHSPETAAVRVRAVALSVVLLVVIPAVFLGVPVPSRVLATASLTHERETVVRASADGFIQEVEVDVGREVKAQDALVRLTNDLLVEEIARASAGLRASNIRQDALRGTQPARAAQRGIEARSLEAALARSLEAAGELDHRAPTAGRVTQCLRRSDVGRFVVKGTPLATLADGAWQVRGIVTESQLVRAAAQVGDDAEFRAAGEPSRSIAGRIIRLAPAGSRAVEFAELTHLGGGDVAVDPTTRTATQPYFVVTVELLDANDAFLRDGMTGRLQLHAQAEPLGAALGRRALRFIDRILLQ